ncbi:hypothetical protein CMK11_17220 [Candidatus Poribacteria bacterium]|nr:hypothetical protein [Candidatus Poribacteria bacterium]
MIEINIVYAFMDPPAVRSFRRGAVRLSWSPVPLQQSIFHVYQGAYSFYGKTRGIGVLMQTEPVVVLPREYTFEVVDRFDYVLTLVDPLAELDAKFRKYNHVAYGAPVRRETPVGLSKRRERYPIDGRRDRACMILGNKTSDIPGEIYSLREPIARQFHEHSASGLDVYGTPAFIDLPNYHGILPPGANRRKMSEYRYCICFENAHDPFWTAGVFSERLLHCIESRTVPIYYGCSNIERYVPPECYVDYREFEDFGELSHHLDEMTDSEYRGYIEAMDGWYESADLSIYHVNELYDQIVRLYAEATSVPLPELCGGDDVWTPTHSDGLTTSVPEDGGSWVFPLTGRTRLQWRWEYLEGGSVDEANAAVAALENGTHVPRDHRQPRPAARARRSPFTVTRVLVVGKVSSVPPLPAEGEYTKHHLLSAWMRVPSVELHSMDLCDIVSVTGAAGFSQLLREKVRSVRPNLLFYVPIAPLYDILLESIHDITAHTDTRTMIWAGTSPELFDDVANEWPRYVDYLVTPAGSLARQYEAAGHSANVIESRWAFDPNTVRPLDVARLDRITLGGERNDIRQQVAGRIQAAALPVRAFGFGWEPQGPLPFDELVAECSRSAVSLSVMSRRRPFEVAGAGGFLMTTKVEEIDGAFVTDEDEGRADAEIVLVRDTAEIVDKARYYLRNPAAREDIRRRGYERAVREHTWEARFRDILRQAGWRLPST